MHGSHWEMYTVPFQQTVKNPETKPVGLLILRQQSLILKPALAQCLTWEVPQRSGCHRFANSLDRTAKP